MSDTVRRNVYRVVVSLWDMLDFPHRFGAYARCVEDSRHRNVTIGVCWSRFSKVIHGSIGMWLYYARVISVLSSSFMTRVILSHVVNLARTLFCPRLDTPSCTPCPFQQVSLRNDVSVFQSSFSTLKSATGLLQRSSAESAVMVAGAYFPNFLGLSATCI